MSEHAAKDASLADAQLTARLRPFSACDVADALTALGVPPENGGFIPGPSLYSSQRQTGDTKVVGPVHVVQYGYANERTPEVKPHYVGLPALTPLTQIDSVPKGAILMIVAPPEATCAVYGGLMSARAQALGALGTIVLGRIRDLEEHRSMSYPVWASDLGTTSPKGFLKVVQAGVKRGEGSCCHDVGGGISRQVCDGDWIIADLNGAVYIPRSALEDVIKWLEERGDSEDKMMEAIKGGMSFIEASKRFRQTL